MEAYGNLFATQDVDLCRRIALHGNLAGTTDLVACIEMGTEGSATDYHRAPTLSRQARESILNEAGVWPRLRASAHSSAWQGKIARIYLTSSVWNFKRRKIFIAASRATWGVAGFISAGKGLFAPDFWHAVTHPYSSPTFLRGFEEAQLTVMTR